MTTAIPSWVCPTCKVDLQTPFCARCGERPIAPRDLTLRGVLVRLTHALTSVDGRMLRSFGQLLRRPGALTVAYLAGVRKPYASPFQLFLLANVLFFAVQSVTGTNIFSSPLDSHLRHQDWSALARTLVDRHLAHTQRGLEQYAPLFDRSVLLYAKSLIILMALAFALLLPIAFWRSRRPFMAHLAFSLHLYAFLMLLFTLAVLAAWVHTLFGGAGLKSPGVDNLLSIINLLACAVYLHLAMARAYGASGWARPVKAAALALAVGAIALGYRFALLLITLALV